MTALTTAIKVVKFELSDLARSRWLLAYVLSVALVTDALLRFNGADQRAVLELQLADLAPREIAATLGRSLNAVRLLRLRAIRGVRPLLEGESAASTRGELAC